MKRAFKEDDDGEVASSKAGNGSALAAQPPFEEPELGMGDTEAHNAASSHENDMNGGPEQPRPKRQATTGAGPDADTKSCINVANDVDEFTKKQTQHGQTDGQGTHSASNDSGGADSVYSGPPSHCYRENHECGSESGFEPLNWLMILSAFPGQCEHILQFEKRLGLSFSRPELLFEAFTHRSALTLAVWKKIAPCDRVSYDILECVGDSVLRTVIMDNLCEHARECVARSGTADKRMYFNEGWLTLQASTLTRAETLAGLAKELGLAGGIMFNHGSAIDGGSPQCHRHSDRIMGDVVEAIIGALYVDQGFDQTKRIVSRWMKARVSKVELEKSQDDAKSRILQIFQAKGAQNSARVLWNTEKVAGPDHLPFFQARILVDGREVASAIDTTKKQAEQTASIAFLKAYSSDAKKPLNAQHPVAAGFPATVLPVDSQHAFGQQKLVQDDGMQRLSAERASFRSDTTGWHPTMSPHSIAWSGGYHGGAYTHPYGAMPHVSAVPLHFVPGGAYASAPALYERSQWMPAVPLLYGPKMSPEFYDAAASGYSIPGISDMIPHGPMQQGLGPLAMSGLESAQIPVTTSLHVSPPEDEPTDRTLIDKLCEGRTPIQYLHETLFQKTGKMIDWRLIEETGEAHRPIFVMSGELSGVELVRASGPSKKVAKETAARVLIQEIALRGIETVLQNI
ncbi:Ribonuclease 3 [Porphyridium purpureum]|uniref:Ribonuclease 3 n=1 Tax=Porphyridium purpureum TaxID=35688 RepID=A0A5J4YVJ8_PORPP|nr:Ribonuclease 3 [Porphyridium purpureum]|eukprot:POR9668..scf227_4